MTDCMAEPVVEGEEESESMLMNQQSMAMTEQSSVISRKEKRKAAKREKRKQKRRELAVKERLEKVARLNDPEEQRRIQMEEEREKERLENERKEFEERERQFLQELARKKAEEEEEQRKALEEELNRNQVEIDNESKEDEDWEYVEEGPPEIIWEGNEIIVKKKRVRVKKQDTEQKRKTEDPDRPTSNPLPPQSEAFADYKNGSMVSAQQLLDSVAQQIPNFGTEQDKAHCPFHIKTGACRFGTRCSRVHFYPDKSSTLLIKNMYNGPGFAWEHDEGLETENRPTCFAHGEEYFAIFGGIVTTALNNVIVTGNASAGLGHEYTDEEIECCYEEFYEDVHTEFLKFGEIVNFKVCKNGSFHLRGNVYVHYKSLDSAVLAYHSTNGRYFAGKQLKCEFIGVTRWKVAICGEYMKSGLKTCSHGTACNFIHCFRNPGGDYEWADWDKPPPKYWVKKMASLFGYSDETGYDKQMEQQSLERPRSCSKMITAEKHRCYSRRPRSREMDCLNANSSRSQYGENDIRKSTHRQRQTSDNRKQIGEPDGQMYEDKRYSTKIQHHNKRSHDSETDHNGCERDGNGYGNIERDSTRKKSRHQAKVLNFWNDHMDDRSRCYGSGSDGDCWDRDRVEYSGRHRHRTSKSSRHQKKAPEILDDHGYGEKQTHGADSGGDWSHDDRDGDRYHGRRERSLRCSKGVSESPDHWCSKNSTHDGDLSGDWLEKSERRHSRTRGSRHFTDLSRFCDICEEPEKQLKWKFQCTESHPVKVEPQGVSRCSHRSRMDFSSTGANDGNSAGKGLRSDGAEEATSSYQYGLIIESHGSQSGYSIDKNMDKVINQESGNDISEKYMNSERNSRSENYEYDSPCRYTARSKSPESGYYSEENIDSRGRWEPDCPKLPRSSRRKGSGLDAEQCGGESDSRDNSYGYYSERRYRHHNHSSSGKHR